jgi:hypothetical protein
MIHNNTNNNMLEIENKAKLSPAGALAGPAIYILLELGNQNISLKYNSFRSPQLLRV